MVFFSCLLFDFHSLPSNISALYDYLTVSTPSVSFMRAVYGRDLLTSLFMIPLFVPVLCTRLVAPLLENPAE